MSSSPEAAATFLSCNNCHSPLVPGRAFTFRGRGQSEAAVAVKKCFWCALRHKPMLKRSLIASLVVGTALTALNQGDLLISGAWNNAMYWKIPLTYCVPFVVATYGALTNSKN